MADTTTDPIKLTVLTDHNISYRRTYRRYIWRPAVTLTPEIGSRRKWLNALVLLYEYEDQIIYATGERYHLREVDEVFNDPDNRWMSLFLEADQTGHAPKVYAVKYERLRMIALYCQLRRILDEREDHTLRA